jgi:integrase
MRCYSITNKHTFNKVRRLAKARGEKYEKILLLATNGGYRIEDVITLRKKDIWDGLLVVFSIKEKKTGITRTLPDQITTALEKIFMEYLNKFDINDFIFPSPRKDKKGKKQHISYNRVYKVFKEIFTIAGIRGAKGTHTFRKTFAEKSRKDNNGDIRKVQEDLGHKELKSTEKYLEIKNNSKIKPWV